MYWMRLFSLVVWGALLVQPLPAQTITMVPESLRPLQGTWIVDAAEQAGMPVEELKGAKLTIGDNQFELQAGQREIQGRIAVRSDVSPKQIDFRFYNGAIWLGIYIPAANQLRLSYVDASATSERPRLFTTTADTPGTMLVMRRRT